MLLYLVFRQIILNNIFVSQQKRTKTIFRIFYFLIKYQNDIVGGIMCPIYKETIYEWFVCGKDGEIKNIYPSVLATWAPIEYAAQNGLEYFDFLGAGKPDDDYGVREFKSKFGGKEISFGRYLRVNNKLLYHVGKTGLNLMKMLK